MALINKLNALGDLVREKTGKLTRIELHDSDTFDVNLEVNEQFTYAFPAGTRSVLIKRLSKNLVVTHNLIDNEGNRTFVNFASSATEEITLDNIEDGYKFNISNTRASALTSVYEFTNYDENGNIIQVEKEVKNTMTLDEMKIELSNVEVGSDPVIEELNVTENGTYTAPIGVNGYSPVIVNVASSGGGDIPEEALTITGVCNYRFSNKGWDWFINSFGNRVTTNNIELSNYMFQDSKVSKIPFDINGKIASSGYSCSGIFKGCQQLTEIPKLNIKADGTDSIFDGCHRLRELKEEAVADIDWSYVDTRTSGYSSSRGNTFANCYSLRKYPNSFLAHGNPVVSNTYSVYYYGFSSCYTLDEIVNLPIQHRNAKWTSNAFVSTFNSCFRLKRLTFETNEDGTPVKIDTWSKQTIDLTKYVGYTTNSNNITNYNSGITADKQVKDDATYQALKDDPDWYTVGGGSSNYSRYNKTSAVETINSLPDLSGGAGSNTIKFIGANGSKTDGGAINTMTEEEIAVATAKGWTVSFA